MCVCEAAGPSLSLPIFSCPSCFRVMVQPCPALPASVCRIQLHDSCMMADRLHPVIRPCCVS